MLRAVGTSRKCRQWDGGNNQSTSCQEVQPHPTLFYREEEEPGEKDSRSHNPSWVELGPESTPPTLGQVGLLAAPFFSGSSPTTNFLRSLWACFTLWDRSSNVHPVCLLY